MKKNLTICLLLLATMNITGGKHLYTRTKLNKKEPMYRRTEFETTSKISDQSKRESLGRANRTRRNFCNCISTLAGSLFLCVSAQHMLTQSVQLAQIYYNKTV